jgi:Peptidase family M23
VIASAPGIVKGTRDGVEDRLMKSDADKQAVASIECGNGVVIAHEGGYETQYCHMRKGSVAVKKGDRVETGARLGEIGYSGAAAFPHMHLSVRKDGRKIDPFSGLMENACEMGDASLWSKPAREALVYWGGDIIQLGWAQDKVSMERLESGSLPDAAPSKDWQALVAYMLAINLRAGDVVTVTMQAPSGDPATNTITLDRNKAQYMLFAGKKRGTQGWASGEYKAQVTVRRGGKLLLDKKIAAQVE